MYTIINSEPGLYTVGFYSPDNVWHPYEDFEDKEAAGEKCNYLNGGKIPKPVLIIKIPSSVGMKNVRDILLDKNILNLRDDYWILAVNDGEKFDVEIVSVKEVSQKRFQEIEASVLNFLNKI